MVLRRMRQLLSALCTWFTATAVVQSQGIACQANASILAQGAACTCISALLQYIRGRLPHNPYLSGDTGPLMRDVKNFICRQLEMSGAPPEPSTETEKSQTSLCNCNFLQSVC